MKRPALRIIFKPLQREAGPGYWIKGLTEGRTVWIDPRHDGVGRTLLHEMIHIENPSWKEWRVQRVTAARWRKMTWREKAELLKLLGHAKIGEEDDE